MRAPDFWSAPNPGLFARLLSPVGAIYGAVAARRMSRAGYRCARPVICVGNFTAGGAGKTPTAIAIAHELMTMGEAPFFLSRGHGGDWGGAPLQVDAALHAAAMVGDEPMLLARAAPVIVSADKAAGAALAIASGASVIVMDDGLQNASLHKDFCIAVVDAGVGVGNGFCMPAGPLRAPMAAQWPHVQAVALIGQGDRGEAVAAMADGRPVLRGALAAEADAAQRMAGLRVCAFAGIGRPEKFYETLEACGAQIMSRTSFPDHHAFKADELAALEKKARSANAQLVTTQKDRVRLPQDFPVIELPVTLQWDCEALRRLLHGALAC